MALCLIILLEYKDRGIFFGWPTVEHKGKISRKMRWDYGPINIIRRYHGYAIGWAAIYTCWYHPMENTVGHLLGFFYTWIIMLQVCCVTTIFSDTMQCSSYRGHSGTGNTHTHTSVLVQQVLAYILGAVFYLYYREA